MTDTSTPPCETETPDLDSIALDLRLVASVLRDGNVGQIDLVTILTDLADAVDSWHEVVAHD